MMAKTPFHGDDRIRPETVVELRGGRVIDAAAGQPYPDGTSVVFQGGRILALPGLPGQPRDLGADLSYDLGGRSVIPGLFNTHAHLHLKIPALVMAMSDMKLVKRHGRQQLHKEMADCLARGITTVRDCVTDDLRDTRELRAAIADGSIPGPRIKQAVLVANRGSTWAPRRGPFARGLAWIASMAYVPFDDPASGVLAFDPDASEATVRDCVDRAIDERGADTLKLYEQRAAKLTYKPSPLMTADQLEAATDQAARRGVPSTIHHVTLESFRRAVVAGPTSLAHVPMDGLLTDEDLDAIASTGCAVEPTLSAAYGINYRLPGVAPEHHATIARLDEFREQTYEAMAEQYWVPELQPSVKAGMRRAAAGKTKIIGLIDVSAALRFHAGYVSVGGPNLARLHARCIPIGCGNDGGVPPCTVSMVAHELAMLDHTLNVGDNQPFTPAEALLCATLSSACAMGLERELGTLSVGKIADIVVLDGDPLVDRTLLAAPAAAVFKDGRLVVDRIDLRV